VPSKEALKAIPKIAVVVSPKRALDHWTGVVKGSAQLVPSKEALKALPKIAVVVPPKRALDHWIGDTQGASQDSSCGVSQESTGSLDW